MMIDSTVKAEDTSCAKTARGYISGPLVVNNYNRPPIVNDYNRENSI